MVFLDRVASCGAICKVQTTNGLRIALLLFACAAVMAAANGQEGSKVTTASPQGIPETAATTTSSAAPQVTLQKRSLKYTVHPTDVLELTFPLTPDFNQTVTVQPDGSVSLRGVGEVSVAGKTLPELNKALTTAYQAIMKDPLIYVDPKDYEKPYFVVNGQVYKPGKFDWRGDVTVAQAIAIAGGFNDNAKHSQVLLFRRVSDEWAQARLINLKRELNAHNLREDPVLQPGDMLYVPKNALSKIKPFIPLPSLGLYSSTF
jgi:polysaccharide biosynthesis/export protein